MTVTAIDAAVTRRIHEPQFWFRDPQTQSRVVFTKPEDAPHLWEMFLDGAVQAYERYGVTSALEYDSISNGDCTTRFVAVLDSQGRNVAGLRVQGPYSDVDGCHAVREWRNVDDRAAVSRMVADRLRDGVIEVKTVWVSRDAALREQLSALISRCVVHSMKALHTRFAVLTTAEHSMRRYRAAGASPALHIPPTPYPSAHYKTFLMWWDRNELHNGVGSEQLRKMNLEWKAIESQYALFATCNDGQVQV